MFTDIYLRASDEAALKAALPFAVDEEGDWKTSEPYLFAFDPIGPVVTQDAVMDEDGETVLTPAVIDDSFHANLRLIGEYSPDIPAEVVITPTNPRRRFA